MNTKVIWSLDGRIWPLKLNDVINTEDLSELSWLNRNLLRWEMCLKYAFWGWLIKKQACFASDDTVVGNVRSILNWVDFSCNWVSPLQPSPSCHWCASGDLLTWMHAPNHIPKVGKHLFKVGIRPKFMTVLRRFNSSPPRQHEPPPFFLSGNKLIGLFSAKNHKGRSVRLHVLLIQSHICAFQAFHCRLVSVIWRCLLTSKRSEDAPKKKKRKKKRPLVSRRRCSSAFKNALSQLDRRTREMPGLNQDAAPVVCKLTPTWTGATEMSPPGAALTSQGRYVINSGARVSALCTAVENDLKQLLFRVVFMETAGQNRKLGTLSVLTSLT